MGHDLSRRAFLKQGLSATAALAAGPLIASSRALAAAYELTPGWMQGALASGVGAAREMMGARP